MMELLNVASTRTEAPKKPEPPEEPRQEDPRLDAVPFTNMLIPACSVCGSTPNGFPVYTCKACYGKTLICASCAPNMHLYPKHAHKANHLVREWQAGFWADTQHIYFHTKSPPDNPPWGVQYDFPESPGPLQLGLNVIESHIFRFAPWPSGTLRLAVTDVPPGRWEICFQISTYPSSFFGDNEIKLLRSMKKLSVRTGMTDLGRIGFAIGTPTSAEGYLDRGEGDPTKDFAGNFANHSVVFGVHKMVKIKMPQVHVIEPGQDLGIYVWYNRNENSFTSEKPEVRERLSFCWALEGIR